jgi:hypothetical protein
MAENMPRFIVRFRGAAPGKEIVARLRNAPSIHVLEETTKMVLLEAEEADLLDVVQPTSEIVIVPERYYERPDTVPSIRQNPSKK